MKFVRATGRRKATVAQVQILPGKGTITRNSQPYTLSSIEREPLTLSGLAEKLDVSITVQGGGFSSWEDAIKLGLARALVKYQEDLKTTMRRAGLLTVDARVKERKKPGLKRARKAPQWQKR